MKNSSDSEQGVNYGQNNKKNDVLNRQKQFQQKNEQLMDEMNDKDKQLKKMEQKLKEQQGNLSIVEKLKYDNDSLYLKMDILTKEKDDLEKQLKKFRKEKELLDQKVQMLDAFGNKNNFDSVQKQKNAEILINEIQTLKDKLLQEQEAQQELQRRLQEYQKSQELILAEKTNQEQLISQIENENLLLKSQIQSLQRENSSIRSTLETTYTKIMDENELDIKDEIQLSEELLQFIEDNEQGRPVNNSIFDPKIIEDLHHTDKPDEVFKKGIEQAIVKMKSRNATPRGSFLGNQNGGGLSFEGFESAFKKLSQRKSQVFEQIIKLDRDQIYEPVEEFNIQKKSQVKYKSV